MIIKRLFIAISFLVLPNAYATLRVDAGNSLVVTGKTPQTRTVSVRCPAKEQAQQNASMRKSNNAAVILQGIAQSCTQLGTVVAAENDKAKQQGILNIMGTVFNVAAQLAYHQPKESVQVAQSAQQAQATAVSQQTKAILAGQLAQITHVLLKELDKPQCKSVKNLSPLLTFLKDVPTQQEQELLISVVLSINSVALPYIQQLFQALQAYVDNNFSGLITEMQNQMIESVSCPINAESDMPSVEGLPLEIINQLPSTDTTQPAPAAQVPSPATAPVVVDNNPVVNPIAQQEEKVLMSELPLKTRADHANMVMKGLWRR